MFDAIVVGASVVVKSSGASVVVDVSLLENNDAVVRLSVTVVVRVIVDVVGVIVVVTMVVVVVAMVVVAAPLNFSAHAIISDRVGHSADVLSP